MSNKLMAKRISRFKAEYNFVPDRDNPTQGVITVDGKTYPIDMDIENPVMFIPHLNKEGREDIGRQMASELYGSERKIHLAKLMFRMPYKMGVAALLHEVGHTELHTVMPQVDNNAEEELVDLCIDFLEEEDGELADMYLCTMYQKMDQIRAHGADAMQLRHSAYQHAKAHEDDSHESHANASEFEADAFAANRIGRFHVALAMIYANLDWLCGQLKIAWSAKNWKLLRDSLWDAKIDITQRVSALCDRKFQNNPIYKSRGA